jgi:membrane-associated protease RseP (regulator of RpoE activity)
MGAVIKIKSPIYDRRALIDIGASGPIVGFIFAVIATSVGLHLSAPIEEAVVDASQFSLGPSILFYSLANIFAPEWQTAGALDLHPVAVAGWVGLFVTAINLMPVGQLDGGHIAYAFMGRHQKKLSFAFIGVLGLMGAFLFVGWIIWALLLLAIGLRHPPVLDENGEIGIDRIMTSVVSLIIFIVTFTPVPVIINFVE